MATVLQTLPQSRTVRATTTWTPPSTVAHTRPWRSSPLAGPAFSTLPTIVAESSEESESHELDFGEHRNALESAYSRSLSSSSIEAPSISVSASWSGSRNTSASALPLPEGDSSASSFTLFGSSSANASPIPQDIRNRPARLSKSPARHPLRPPSETFITPPPRARTLSHGHSRPVSFPVAPMSTTIPRAYSRSSPFQSDVNTRKQPSSTSREPASNWMPSFGPFGPVSTPKFSRLSMASPAVVMPLSAKEFRKQKVRASQEKLKFSEPSSSANHVTFSHHFANDLPLVRVSPPSPENLRQDPSPLASAPLPSADLHPPNPRVTVSAQPQPRLSLPKQRRTRPRPNTPPRPSPLASHAPVSPKSSAGSFLSFTSDDHTPLPSLAPGPDAPPLTDDPDTANAVPPARPRPRPRPRRSSYPDRLSNGARLSLLEAMNRLSQENTSLHHLSGISPLDEVNRLSVASQASGHTVFYDTIQSEDDGQVADGNVDGTAQRASFLHTQSLEDLSSSLARTGIGDVHSDGNPVATLADGQKKRNVRMVRISDTVEVSSPPIPRRRKLTKRRPGSVSGSVRGKGSDTEPKVEAQKSTLTFERRVPLLSWKSRKASGNKSSASEKGDEDGGSSILASGIFPSNPPIPISRTPTSVVDGSAQVQSHAKLETSHLPTKRMSSDTPRTMTNPGSGPESLPSTPSRKSRRYSFSFLPSSPFSRSKREKSNTTLSTADLGPDHSANMRSNLSVQSVESSTDSPAVSIRTVTQGSQSTITPVTPDSPDFGKLPFSGSRSRQSSSAIPMLRRLNAQEMATPEALLQSEWYDKGSSTPSLITTDSTGTSSSFPRTLTPPSFARFTTGEQFIPRPSGLKKSFLDISEEDSDDARGTKPRTCVHQRRQSPLARGGVGMAETSEEDEQLYLRPISGVVPISGLGRPDTSSSTATESESYISFSTVDPMSTASSSSRSASPIPVVDEAVSYGDGVIHACALCGHPSPRLTSPPFLLSSRTEMHPMFTVPLLTVPSSTLSLPQYPPLIGPNVSRAIYSAGGDMAGGRSMAMAMGERQGGDRKGKGRASAPVPVTAIPPSTRVEARRNGYSSEPILTMSPKMKTDKASPAKMRKRRRSPSAPPAVGEATFPFMRARKGSVDAHVGDEKQDHLAKSKFRTMLKGLLRWNR